MDALSPWHGTSSGFGGGYGLQIGRAVVNIQTTQLWKAKKRVPPAIRLGGV